MTRVQELIEQLKALSPEEREEFDVLFAGEQAHSEFADEWDDEISRRIDDWKSGKAGTVSWETIEATLRAKLDAS